MEPLEHHDEYVIEMFCEECGADFTVEHEMGLQYIPHHCVFCGSEIYREEENIDYDEIDKESIH